MKWEKIGLIFNPDIFKKSNLTAALMPIVEAINDRGLIRIYFAPRDEKNRSEFRYFEINIYDPQKILTIAEEPLFFHGKLGCFDDSGITPGNIVNIGNKKLLYYTGWNLTVNVPMNNSIGVAEFGKDGKLFRYGDGPIMTRTLHEPYSCASPFVMLDENIYKMWYASMDKWAVFQGVPQHYYNIKYAESKDGIIWERKGEIAINYEKKDEYAFGRPFLIKENNLYKMWYAFRGAHYKIGYAESENGINWKRKDEEAGIAVSKKGWDSEMIEYPCIFDYNNERYMFYNGNGYGKTGIGMAKLTH